MNRLSKAILIVCVSLAAVALVAIVAVNLYLQSPGTQARIQEEIRRALRVPLRITSTSITPWGGLRISGITIPGERANFLHASSFHAKYQFLPLLRKKLIIDSMVLDRPQIVWAKNDAGKWVLPALPEPENDQKDDSEEKSDEPTEKVAKPKRDSRELEVVIKGFEIREGLIELWDEKGARVARGSGVGMNYTTMRADRMEGQMRIGELVWKESIFLSDIESPFRYADGEIALTDLKAKLAGGSIEGKASINPDKDGTPFRVNISGTRIDLGRLTTEAGLAAGHATGMFAMSLELEGESRQAERAEGRGSIQLVDAEIKRLEFFQTLGQVLQIPELADLKLRDGAATFEIRDEKAFIEDMVLETADLRLNAKGMLRIDGKVQLEAKLSLSERSAGRLHSALRKNLSPPDETGARSIPFKITGKLDRPKTDLLDSLIGGKISSQFDDFLSSFLGVKKKDDDKKDKSKDKDKKKKKKDDKDREEEEEPSREQALQVQ